MKVYANEGIAQVVFFEGEVPATTYADRSGKYQDQKGIVTASQDKTARVWDAKTGSQLALLSGHEGVVIAAAFSPDGQRIVTTSRAEGIGTPSAQRSMASSWVRSLSVVRSLA